ncbi:cereblon family protein [Maridesulfovibrio sp.]|uniref:cereblon family protein n=1 Tax=Maridesulfovibrio sp. TaxID=2795000 RepID=UPI0029CA476F|nr:cereblon family protein [Maridesulfovibrio sp.]
MQRLLSHESSLFLCTPFESKLCWAMQISSSTTPYSLLKSSPSNPIYDHEVKDQDSLHDFKKKITCRSCGAEITDSSSAVKINNKHEHSFFNPHGYVFQIRCFSSAQGCISSGRSSSEFTWFPGHTWQIAGCSTCMTHLGWKFQSELTSFYGLIRDKISD